MPLLPSQDLLAEVGPRSRELARLRLKFLLAHKLIHDACSCAGTAEARSSSNVGISSGFGSAAAAEALSALSSPFASAAAGAGADVHWPQSESSELFWLPGASPAAAEPLSAGSAADSPSDAAKTLD